MIWLVIALIALLAFVLGISSTRSPQISEADAWISLGEKIAAQMIEGQPRGTKP